MVKTDDLERAIQNGAITTTEIAEELGKSTSAIRRRAKKAAEDPETDIIREPDPQGSGHIYGLQAEQDADADLEMPVFGDRDYDWTQYVPAPSDDVYVEVDGERSDMDAIIDAREATGQLPRFRLTGPPGTGKTTLAESIAARRQWPLITVQVTATMRDPELLGSPHIIGGESVWVDGPLVKALLCSQERPVVVLLDEVNRAPFERKSSLQAFLDHRAQAELTLRGGELIEGDAGNIVTVATMNEGAEYETFAIDPAERRRHGNTWEVPYLGFVDADREAGIVADRTPADERLASAMVGAANDVRRMALEDPTSVVDSGVATSTLLEWARTMAAYRHAGRPDPVGRAARTAIAEPHYDGDADTPGSAAAEVHAVLADGISVAAADEQAAADGDRSQ